MEFHEKLQELRKKKGLTQEELAEVLYVSRTAISKWEQGRGYPNLDSLREISKFFSVSIDDLLSGDALLSIAEKEHQSKLRRTYDLLLGIIDLCAFVFIVLPLYPQTVGGTIYAVNLFAYDEIASSNLFFYWVLFILLMGAGALKLILLRYKPDKPVKVITDSSISLNAVLLILLTISREAYAAVLVALMLITKMLLLLKSAKEK